MMGSVNQINSKLDNLSKGHQNSAGGQNGNQQQQQNQQNSQQNNQQQQNQNKNSRNAAAFQAWVATATCHNCGQVGHLKPRCPNPRVAGSQQQQIPATSATTFVAPVISGGPSQTAGVGTSSTLNN